VRVLLPLRGAELHLARPPLGLAGIARDGEPGVEASLLEPAPEEHARGLRELPFDPERDGDAVVRERPLHGLRVAGEEGGGEEQEEDKSRAHTRSYVSPRARPPLPFAASAPPRARATLGGAMEEPRPLDAEAFALFARKGREGGPDVPQSGEANGVKVRRVMQLVADLARRPFRDLRILDLGCGEGVYAIEAALAGAQVTALDARTERMSEGAAVAARHGLTNVRFQQEDVRNVSRATHGEFDVVLLLGLLYHLDAPAPVLRTLHGLCAGLLVVDTLVAPDADAELDGYRGRWHREHGDDDPPEARRSRVLKSIDNAMSFRLTRESLVRALRDVGFTTVLECHAPLEPGKAEDRITLAAVKGEGVHLATYPWVNGRSEDEIARRLEAK
jgi:SAM-dependent methyltransferase